MKDIQGVQRGKCNTCECEEYRTSPKPQPGQLRCEYCNHTPGEHVKIIELGACSSCGKEHCDKYQSEDPNSYTDCEYCGCYAQMHAGADKLRKPRPQSQQPGASMTFSQMMSMTFGQMMSMTFGQMMSQGPGASGFQPRYDTHDQPVKQITYGTCKCPGCTFPKRREGDKIHDFCSSTCAKKFNEIQSSSQQQKVATKTPAQALRGSGQPSYDAILSSGSQATSRSSSSSNAPTKVLISGGESKKPGYRPPATGGESGSRSTAQALKGSEQPYFSSGRQEIFKVLFQKSSSKDIGLIVSDEMYRCDTFSGLLVLGFQYNTKAEHLIKSGYVHVLDVITSLNDKEVSPLTYKEEAKNSSCSLKLNRSIALPQLKPLMDKAEFSIPTSLVAVMNPKDYPNCSTAQGFGLRLTFLRGTTSVVSVTENTPARFSRLKYGDEIITYGFVKNNKLEVGKGALTTNLEEAASHGKTLVVVVNKPDFL